MYSVVHLYCTNLRNKDNTEQTKVTTHIKLSSSLSTICRSQLSFVFYSGTLFKYFFNVGNHVLFCVLHCSQKLGNTVKFNLPCWQPCLGQFLAGKDFVFFSRLVSVFMRGCRRGGEGLVICAHFRLTACGEFSLSDLGSNLRYHFRRPESKVFIK